MILESAQLLSTAHRVLDGAKRRVINPSSGRASARYVLPSPELDQALYAATHVNHPCALWVRESSDNYDWLYELMIELNNEFVRRYNKSDDHLTIRKLKTLLKNPPKNIPSIGITKPPHCMPEEYQVDDTIQSYHNYYIGAKQNIAQWTNTPTPPWFKNFRMK